MIREGLLGGRVNSKVFIPRQARLITENREKWRTGVDGEVYVGLLIVDSKSRGGLACLAGGIEPQASQTAPGVKTESFRAGTAPPTLIST